MNHNEWSSLPEAGFLEELPEVLDIPGTCCLHSRLFEGMPNRTRACTSKLVDFSQGQDK